MVNYAQGNIKIIISLRFNFPLLPSSFSKEFACNKVFVDMNTKTSNVFRSSDCYNWRRTKTEIKVLLTTFCCSGLVRESQVSRAVFHVRTTT